MLKIRHLIGLLGLVSICFLYVVWYIFKQRDLTGPDAEKFSDIFGHAVRWRRSDGVVNNEFRVHANYRSAEESVSSDITLVSQCSVNNFYWVIQQAKGWSAAPISIAIFAAGPEGHIAKQAIDKIRACVPEVRKFVTFHLLYPTAFPPSLSGKV